MSALAAVSGILRFSHKSYLIRPSTVVDLPQLRTQSAVLIGAFNNSWTLRLTAPLRFDFVQDLATKTKWIQDRKNPGMRGWSIVTTTPYELVTDDWAVISSFRIGNRTLDRRRWRVQMGNHRGRRVSNESGLPERAGQASARELGAKQSTGGHRDQSD